MGGEAGREDRLTVVKGKMKELMEETEILKGQPDSPRDMFYPRTYKVRGSGRIRDKKADLISKNQNFKVQKGWFLA